MATVKNTILMQDKSSKVLKNIMKALNSTMTALSGVDQISDTAFNRMKRDIEQAERAIDDLSNSTKTLNDSVNQTAGGFTVFKGIIANVGASLLAKGAEFLTGSVKNAIERASDLAEVQNVVDVTFGKSAGVINEWSKTTLKAYGLSELSAKQYSGTLGAMLKSINLSGDAVNNMSMDMAQLAADMASFYNLDLDTAFTKIRAGLSGETEPLKQLGINMSVANLEAYAMANGLAVAYDKLSQADQTIIRYNYLMQATADAHGDFMRTSDGYANQQRLLQENWGQFTATLASGVLPYLTNLLIALNNGIDALNSWVEKGTGLGDTLQKLLPYIIGIGTAILIYNIPVISTLILKYATMGVVALATGVKMALAWAMANAPLLAMIAAITFAVYAYNNLGTAGKILAVIIGVVIVALGIWITVQWALNAALTANPIGVIIMAIATLIGLITAAIAAIIYLWKNNLDFKYGVIAIWNSILGFFDKVPIFFMRVGYGIADAFSVAKVKSMEALQSLANGAIKVINDLISMLNKIPSVSIPLLNELTFAASVGAEEEAKRQARKDSLESAEKNVAEKQAERLAKMQKDRLADEKALAQKKAEQDAKKKNTVEEDLNNKLKGYNANKGDFSNMKVAGGKIDKVGKIDSDVSISNEDIEYLRDIAKFDYVNKFTTLRPEINVTFGDVHETADVDELMEKIEDMVVDAYATILTV